MVRRKDVACSFYCNRNPKSYIPSCILNGLFNKYVDQILPNLDPLLPRVDKRGHFTYPLLFPHEQKHSKVAHRKNVSSNMSRLEAHAGFFRLLMKGIFDPYVL